MGFAGGLVPSPLALVVLLGAIALGRAWFGVLLVVACRAGRDRGWRR
jgi:nickel/cobalt transporter (NicO) family protein